MHTNINTFKFNTGLKFTYVANMVTDVILEGCSNKNRFKIDFKVRHHIVMPFTEFMILQRPEMKKILFIFSLPVDDW